MYTQDDTQSTASQASNQDQAQPDLESPLKVANQPTSAPTDDYVGEYQPPVDEGELTADATQPLAQSQLTDKTQLVDQAQPTAQTSSTTDDPLTQKTDDSLKKLEELLQEFESKTDKVSPPASKPVDQPVASPTQRQDPMDQPTESTTSSVQPLSMTDPLTISSPMTQNQSATQVNDPVQPPVSSTEPSEKLVDQNIFFLLGAEDGSTQEKDKFLDELQQTIWQDFIEKDLALLITSEEKIKADQILQDTSLSDLEKQEQLLEYANTLVPDLEQIMLEKALQLKQDLVGERIASLKDSAAQDEAKQQQLQQVEELLAQGKWYSAGKLLNQVG